MSEEFEKIKDILEDHLDLIELRKIKAEEKDKKGKTLKKVRAELGIQ